MCSFYMMSKNKESFTLASKTQKQTGDINNIYWGQCAGRASS